jgi:hypothetical protein
MTTIVQQERTCALCGEKSHQNVVSSTNVFGSPDLDLRPPEMRRSTMMYWVEECPHCCYVYGSIELLVPGAETVVQRPELPPEILRPPRSIWARLLFLHNPPEPAAKPKRNLVKAFSTASRIAELGKQIEKAAEYALWAAWAADDAKDNQTAKLCRDRAADLFRTFLSDAENSKDQRILISTRLADILRRAEHWNEAIQLAAVTLDEVPDGPIRDVLAFEIAASQKSDAACYRIADVIKPNAAGA